jgi:ubiquinone/menaquinone biosynthesis C-methylase UbiE
MGNHLHVWDEVAAQRLLSNDRKRSENAAFLNYIIGPNKLVIVDLGCGSGFYAAKLKPFASILYCIDSSKAMLSVARNRIHGKTVRFLEEDSSRTSLPALSVDVVFLANSFHDMDRHKTSAEVNRILKFEGRIIVVDWKKGIEQSGERRCGPPDKIRMSETDYLRWFTEFKITKRFEVGKNHFGIVLMR